MVSHATPPGARIGQTRADQRGGHIPGVHIGKAASSPASLRRRDSDIDLQPPSDEPRRAPNTPIVGEPRGVINDRR
jgi:hypothetical protein